MPGGPQAMSWRRVENSMLTITFVVLSCFWRVLRWLISTTRRSIVELLRNYCGTCLNFAQLKDFFISYLHTSLLLFPFPFAILCSSGLRVVSCSTIFPHCPELSAIVPCFAIPSLSRFLFSPSHSITSLGFPWPPFAFPYTLSHSFTFCLICIDS